ncbi:MAG: class II aldolase/adducin family protein [Acidibacillus sp.]|uniref:3-oxo-tetronate 4-phosphate decarboxylase n=1 Tax=Sulfoacidibacillus ferrooxidans TaxID=2005001 RepID=A0A9X1V6G8_9BACL|nr:class II aldolase/adducin family protein [Sulfoacidibacillus ferrooxidans]MCI0182072.1 3-oxo-tetronate 4-phosphate decarboxylase [Sulfoacidibacillus ferrooxidans]MCY0892447.1 class II aldolase/adducin family protein [Acidibacillus sp.]
MSDKTADQLREELVQVAHRLFDAGVMFKGEHANLSARLGKDQMVITRGGSVAKLSKEDFAIVTLDGTVVEGHVEPVLAEVIEMHAAVYRARESVGGIIHNHAPHITTFAIAHQPIPVVYEPLLRFGITEAVPVVPWAPRGSAESVNGIVDIVKNHPGLPAVILANHGVLAFGATPLATAQIVTTLDEAAELVIQARMIGGEKALPQAAFAKVQEHMLQFAQK